MAEDLLKSQLNNYHRLTRVVDNLKKKGAANITQGAVQSRLDLLEQLWREFERTHCELEHEDISHVADHKYFGETYFDLAEDAYLDQRGTLLDFQRQLQPAASSAEGSTSATNSSEPNEHRPRAILPRIELPKFDGQYREWAMFHDLFSSLVISDLSLSDVERLHYLKGCVKGEAALLLNNLPITETNFRRAWTTLCDRYQNKRLLVQSHLFALSSIPAVKRESATEIKQLLFGTWDVIGALAELGRPVTNSTDWLVHSTVEKLDSRSRREWETKLGSATDPPSLSELKSFLETRVHTLEALERRRGEEPSENRPVTKRVNPKVHQVAEESRSSRQCELCKGQHYILYCPQFRRRSPTEKRATVQTLRRCLNCLGTHSTEECSSAKRCQHCAEKHHTCIHEACAEARGSAVQHVVPKRGERRTVILGLARVRVCDANGHYLTTRALIDPGSEVSLISERLIHALGLSYTRARVPLSFAGGVATKSTKGRVRITTCSIHDEQKRLRFTALVLPRLTDYRPSKLLAAMPWPHIQDLPMAEPNLNCQEPVELLLGADVYGDLLLDGVRRHGQDAPVAQETRFGWILTGCVRSETHPTSHRQSCHTVQIGETASDLTQQ